MQVDKELLQKSLDVLIEKADDVSELAKAQRASADEQHDTAHKLEDISRSLKLDAAEIKGEMRHGASHPGKKSAA